MRTRIRVLFAMCLPVAACGSSDVTTSRLDTGVPDVDPVEDVADVTGDVAADTDPVEVGVDVQPDSDVQGDVPLDAETDAGGPRGEPCTGDDECSPFVCFSPVPGDARGICVAPCADAAQCDEGEICQLVSSDGGDTLRVCVPEALCLDDDGDGYGFGAGCRGPDCDETDPLVYLGAVETCDGVDNNCDDRIDNDVLGIGGDCVSGFAGVCAAGRLACADGAVTCEALTVPTDERCDGLDNDCDGAVDEDASGAPLARPCYSGPASTRDVGECRAGAEVCVDGAFATCSDQVLPIGEVCDGLDNDCDGAVDSGNPGAGLSCPTALPGECSAGVTACSDGAVVCEPISPGRAEICDGRDNDCDDATDEGDDGAPLARACYTGPDGTLDVGICRAGTETCDSAAWGVCRAQVLPATEVCDGRDNNCDGLIDDGNPGAGMLCATGRPGECAAGVTACVDGGVACLETTSGRPELCDGADNDCDGVIDNGNPGGGGACSTGRAGVCAAGLVACTGATLVCEQQVAASTEVCDGLDNNCDGRADEGNPGGGGACNTGRPGICAAGVLACTGGGLACAQTNAATGELCDGLDNNCNGVVDDGCPTSLTLASGVSSPQYGGGGGTPFTYNCPSGSALVGLFGRAGSEIDAIGARCAPVSLSEDRSVTPYRYRATTGALANGTQYGGGGGTAFSSACPANQVVIGVNVRGDARLDRVQWVCGSLEVTGNPGSLSVTRSQDGVSTAYGGNGGDPYSYLCPSNQIVTGIFGRYGSRVDAFGVRCSTPNTTVR